MCEKSCDGARAVLVLYSLTFLWPPFSFARQARQSQSRVRATVAPLSSAPPNKMPRPSLTLSHSRPFFQDYEEEDLLMAQRK